MEEDLILEVVFFYYDEEAIRETFIKIGYNIYPYPKDDEYEACQILTNMSPHEVAALSDKIIEVNIIS